jgi:hypothetical protein
MHCTFNRLSAKNVALKTTVPTAGVRTYSSRLRPESQFKCELLVSVTAKLRDNNLRKRFTDDTIRSVRLPNAIVRF